MQISFQDSQWCPAALEAWNETQNQKRVEANEFVNRIGKEKGQKSEFRV